MENPVHPSSFTRINPIAVTLNGIGAYQNIPQEDGIDCLYEALEERPLKDIPLEFIKNIMELVETCNISTFNEDLWKQLVGVAMGIHPAPSYANIYVARRIYKKIEDLGKKYGKNYKTAILLFNDF